MNSICRTCIDCAFLCSDNSVLNNLGEAVITYYCLNPESDMTNDIVTPEMPICSFVDPIGNKIVIPVIEEVILSSVLLNNKGLVCGHIDREENGKYSGWLLNQQCKLENLTSDHLYDSYIPNASYDTAVTWLRNKINKKHMKENHYEEI